MVEGKKTVFPFLQIKKTYTHITLNRREPGAYRNCPPFFEPVQSGIKCKQKWYNSGRKLIC
jgi:hypothetical protein